MPPFLYVWPISLLTMYDAIRFSLHGSVSAVPKIFRADLYNRPAACVRIELHNAEFRVVVLFGAPAAPFLLKMPGCQGASWSNEFRVTGNLPSIGENPRFVVCSGHVGSRVNERFMADPAPGSKLIQISAISDGSRGSFSNRQKYSITSSLRFTHSSR